MSEDAARVPLPGQRPAKVVRALTDPGALDAEAVELLDAEPLRGGGRCGTERARAVSGQAGSGRTGVER
jgi:hypothetical protein